MDDRLRSNVVHHIPTTSPPQLCAHNAQAFIRLGFIFIKRS